MLKVGLQVYTLSAINKNHRMRAHTYAGDFVFLSSFLFFYSEMGKFLIFGVDKWRKRSRIAQPGSRPSGNRKERRKKK
jgi:hypothetical protein